MEKMVESKKPFSVFSLEADRDYILARLINFAGSGFASRSGYSGQQALEKYLKACLVQQYQKYPEVHNLIKLAEHCKDIDPVFTDEAFLKKLKKFDDFWDVGRYGGAAKYDPHAKHDGSLQTAGVFDWSETDIKILDELVFEIRGKLNFAAIEFSDSLDAIVKDNKSDRLFSSWKLPCPLKDVLTTENDFFH